MKRKTSIILYAIIIALMSACDATPVQEAQPIAVDEPEPETEILVPTLAPAGLPDNPLRFVIVPHDPTTAPEYVATLADAILQASSVTVEVILAQNNADALAALCATTPEQVAVAVLDGFSWLAAEAQNCGDATLRLQATNASNAPISDPVHILLNDSYRSTDLSILQAQERVFCRIAVTDIASWLVPALTFNAQGINVTTFGTIADYPDYDAMLTAFAEGECDGGTLPQSLYRTYNDADDERIEAVRIAQTSVGLPYGVLVYPSQIPLAARLSLTEGLLRLFVSARTTPETPSEAEATAEPESTPELAPPADWFAYFFGDYGIGRMGDNDFSDLRNFIADNNLNLGILGQ